jgi:hypothetical protein
MVAQLYCVGAAAISASIDRSGRFAKKILIIQQIATRESPPSRHRVTPCSGPGSARRHRCYRGRGRKSKKVGVVDNSTKTSSATSFRIG